jgi:hypothetical protein
VPGARDGRAALERVCRIATTEDAVIFADKANEPYILHPLRVALRVHIRRR